MASAPQGQQANLLQESLDYILSRGSEMPQAFYEDLFASYPEFTKLFVGVDLSAQHGMFLSALKYVVQNYENRGSLARTLRQLGERHVGYGIRAEHYAGFGECMLRTMARICGPRWSLQLELAWRTAFENVAEIMLESGADSDRGPAAQAG